MLPSVRPSFGFNVSFFCLHSRHDLFHFCNKSLSFHTGSKTLSTKPSSLHMQDSSVTSGEASISLQEWQGWGTTSPVPAMVNEVIDDLRLLEKDSNSQMTFDGNHGRLTGDFKVQEDKKHRKKYESLGDSEKKLQFFSARQIACRLLGSRGYLCQKCWLAMEDCMCSKVAPYPLTYPLKFWLYMHPKDFLRQNNTGKLLWQIFGVEAAKLCLFGITEQEEIMWNAFSISGRNKVWCLYPNKNAVTESIRDIIDQTSSSDLQCRANLADGDHTIHFILIDGTWNNSSAMFKRLQDRANCLWQQELRCLSLNTGASLMHKLRPQPSWDRTCTAAAAIGLLYELHQFPELSSFGLDKMAEAVGDALEELLEALTNRRLRMGRSITRKQKHGSSCC